VAGVWVDHLAIAVEALGGIGGIQKAKIEIGRE
jgi:hypothetical protein